MPGNGPWKVRKEKEGETETLHDADDEMGLVWVALASWRALYVRSV